jgi:hypothetical protein
MRVYIPFNGYCMSVGIKVEHVVAHVYTQNDFVESLIKILQLSVRLLLMKYSLPSSAREHAILYAVVLIRLRPTAYHKLCLLQLVSGKESNLSHIKNFGCVVYVPISPP